MLDLVKDEDLSGMTISYNGVQFDGTSPHRMFPPIISVQGSPVLDFAKRTQRYLQFSMTVETVIFADNEVNQQAQMQDIRNKLSRTGGTLKIQGFGWQNYGDNTIVDIDNGPHCEVVSLTPSVAPLAWRLVWTVRFAIHECADWTESNEDLSIFESFAYQQQWVIDAEGLSKRTISGEYTIPRWRGATEYATTISDQMRDNITLLVPLGWRRVSQSWNQSADGKTTAFQVVDEELPGTAPPPGMIRANGSISVESKGPAFIEGFATLSCNYRIRPGTEASVAGVYFFVLMASVHATLMNTLKRKELDPDAEQDRPNQGAVIPRQMTMGKGLFDSHRDASFTIVFSLAGSVRSILESGAFWNMANPVDENGDPTNINQWTTSVEPNWTSRGITRYRPDATEMTAVVDLCTANTSATIGSTVFEPLPPTMGASYAMLCPSEIDKENSYIAYDIIVSAVREENDVRHRLAQSVDEAGTPDTTDMVSAGSPNAKIGEGYTISAGMEDVVEYRGAPRVRIAVQFVSQRVKFKPQIPALKTLNNKVVVPTGRSVVETKKVGNFGNCPIYQTRSVRIYEVVGSVGDIIPVKSPLDDTEGEDELSTATIDNEDL